MPGAEHFSRPRRDALCIGDAERDAAAATLREHHVAGRLDVAEFERRAAVAVVAVAARTDDELVPLFRDLPRLGRGLPALHPTPAPGKPAYRGPRWPYGVAIGVASALFAAALGLIPVADESVEALPAPVVQVDSAEDDAADAAD